MDYKKAIKETSKKVKAAQEKAVKFLKSSNDSFSKKAAKTFRKSLSPLEKKRRDKEGAEIEAKKSRGEAIIDKDTWKKVSSINTHPKIRREFNRLVDSKDESVSRETVKKQAKNLKSHKIKTDPVYRDKIKLQNVLNSYNKEKSVNKLK